MPSTNTICYYAMYVIGEVESNWSWTSVNYNDPITIGMMQWYGTRAAGLLERIQDEMPTAYEQLASSLRASLSSYSSSNSYWNSRYLTQTEGNSIVEVFQSEDNHIIQENQAISDFEGYISTLEGWGLSQERPKPLIFTMAMYHQSPSRAGNVIQTAGGETTLDRVYSICLNDSVLGKYKTRYTTVYNRLNAWDGESEPPDFGQVGTETTGGDSGGIGVASSDLGYIIKRGQYLVLYGLGNYADGVVFSPASSGRWTCGFNADGTTIDTSTSGGGSETGSAAQNAVVSLYRSWENQFAYSQGAGRLTPTTSGYGDCSSTIWYAYQQVAGIDVGTWTGAMAEKGTKVASGYSSDNLPISSMEPADIVLIKWNAGSFDHAELYMGDNVLWGHGGPGYGPNETTSSASTYPSTSGMYYWEVRRYL